MFLFSSFHFFDLKLRLRGPGMCFFVNLNLQASFEAGCYLLPEVEKIPGGG